MTTQHHECLFGKPALAEPGGVCLVCSHPISNESQPYNDIGWTDYKMFHDLHVYHCDSCGFGFSFPELSDKLVNYFYENLYRAKSSTFYFDFNKIILDGIGVLNNNRSFAQLMLARAYCEFDDKDIFLDIGPGRGGSFAIATALLQRPQLYGIELSQGACEFYHKGYGALTYKSIDDFSKLEKNAKIILMSHSLEHYRQSELPELFSKLARALDENGVLIIEVPNVDLRIHSGVRGVDTPHFLFFSKQSLSLMLANFGFSILFIDTCGNEYRTTLEQDAILNSRSNKIKKFLKSHLQKSESY